MKWLYSEAMDRIILSIFFLALTFLAIVWPKRAIETIEDFLAD